MVGRDRRADAALGGRTALWLWDVLDAPPDVVTVCVPESRQVVAPAGVQVVRRRSLVDRVHPVAVPARLRIEEALLDIADETVDEGAVIGLVLRGIASRRTTPDRVRAALARRTRHRHRRLLHDLLQEAADGVQSALESRYRRGVERVHGLPRGERNRPEDVVGRTGAPRRRYRDVRYRRYRLVVELDGLEAHPSWQRRKDRERDNSATMAGDRVLGYGWHETVADPCPVAVEVVRMLWAEGWRGLPRPCTPSCPIAGILP